MMHPLVEHLLDAYGFAESVGHESLYDAFSEYLRAKKRSAADVEKTDSEVSEFVEWFFDTQEEGDTEYDDVDEPERKPRHTWDGETSEISASSGSELDEDDVRFTRKRKKPPETVYIDLADTDEEEPEDYLSYDEEDLIECSDDDFEAKQLKKTNKQPPINKFFTKLPLSTRPTSTLDSTQANNVSTLLKNHTSMNALYRNNNTHTNNALADNDDDDQNVFRPASPSESSLDILDFVNKMVFNNTSFRPRQKDIITNALSDRDVFVLMPTGGGKSLCYQLPAVIKPGITIVVTPLLSLMQDQVQALCSGHGGGVPATYLSSQQTTTEARAVHMELAKQKPTIKLLYVTPEQLAAGSQLQQKLASLYSRRLLSRLVIDECHCVSQWGHDFRPDYQKIGQIKRTHFPNLPIMALTATATEKVREDILSSLHMRQCTKFSVSFFRENLTFRIIPKEYSIDSTTGLKAWEARLLQYIAERPHDTGIIYCLSRDDTEYTAKLIRDSLSIPASHYHAGMTPKQRTEVQNAWRNGRINIVAATIAFGMGIDHATVRYVVHATMSKSLEGYYQEAGRAGRDGLPAECILFYGRPDGPRLLNLLRAGKRRMKNRSQQNGSGSSFQRELAQFNSMTEYCKNSMQCRHSQLLAYLGERWERGRCGDVCDVCRNEVVKLSTVAEKKGQRKEKKGRGGGGSGSGVGANANARNMRQTALVSVQNTTNTREISMIDDDNDGPYDLTTAPSTYGRGAFMTAKAVVENAHKKNMSSSTASRDVQMAGKKGTTTTAATQSHKIAAKIDLSTGFTSAKHVLAQRNEQERKN